MAGLFIGAAGLWRRQEKPAVECGRAEVFGRAFKATGGCARSLRKRLDHRGHLHAMRCVAVQSQTRDAGGMAKHASKSEQLAVRIEPALRAALEAAAASDRRPVSQYVRNRERQVERVANR